MYSNKFPISAVVVLVLLIVLLAAIWGRVSAVDLPYIRPFMKGAKEFRVERDKVLSLNGYLCRHASVNLWKALQEKYPQESKGSAVLIVQEIRARAASGEVQELHSFVYFNGYYLDPTKNQTFKRMPKKYRVLGRLTRIEEIEESLQLNEKEM